jgi:cytochrome P450
MFQLQLSTGFFAPVGYVIAAIKQIIRQRREASSSKRNDVLQMMIDVTSTSTSGSMSDDDSEDVANGKQNGTIVKPDSWKSLSEEELVAQCMQIFVAGYETTSTTLSFICDCLATNPEVQEKLYAEVVDKFPSQGQPDYDTLVNQMPYLDAVCKETIRLYPVGFNVFNRFVMNDTCLNGVTVPKSVELVQMDMWSIHRNEHFWGPVDPNKFYPDRFLAETTQQKAFLGFGMGPRLCLGRRLALLEMKQTIANILLRFKIVAPDGGYPGGGKMRITSKSGPLLPQGGVWVRMVPRH